jgi:hypothetical protein
LAAAISDRVTGEAVHFACILAEITRGEILEKGDVVSYLGGGRFGVIHFSQEWVNQGNRGGRSRGDNGRRRSEAKKGEGVKVFTIKRVFEWEDRDNRASWRSVVCDHYSIT